MFAAIAQFFAMFTTLFSAGQKAASAINNITEWADESSAQFKENAREERKQKQLVNRAKYNLIAKDAESIAQKQMDDESAHNKAKKQLELDNE